MQTRIATDLTDEELLGLAVMLTYIPAARKEYFQRCGLGDFGASNPTVKSLVSKGWLRIQGGKNVVMVDKDKVRAELKKHRPPPGAKNLSNWSFTFKPREDSDKEASVKKASNVQVHATLRRMVAYVEGSDGPPSRAFLADWLEKLAAHTRG